MVEEFIAGEYFVDPYALNIWLAQGGKKTRYEEVKKEVVEMFRCVNELRNKFFERLNGFAFGPSIALQC